MSYRITGILVAHAGDREMNVEIHIEDASISIRAFGSGATRTIHAQKPAAIAFVDTLAAELLSTATTPEDRIRSRLAT